VEARWQGLPCRYIPKFSVFAQLYQSEPHAPLHGAERQAEALCYLHVRKTREVSELEDLLLEVRESIECFAHPTQAGLVPGLGESLARLVLGADASTFSCILRRLARARSWSMPWLRTTERIQVRTLPLCARDLSADRQTLKKASWVRFSVACFSPVSLWASE
jgi:hypothetical protein